MTEAAKTLPRAPLFGIASCPVGATGLLEFEIGWDEFERDVQWAESLIRSSGLGPGDLVLITISQWEGPWTTPVVTALRRIGVTYLTAEVWNFDARRTSMFLQRLPVKAVFGLAGDTLAALDNEDPPLAELLPMLRPCGPARTPWPIFRGRRRRFFRSSTSDRRWRWASRDNPVHW